MVLGLEAVVRAYRNNYLLLKKTLENLFSDCPSLGYTVARIMEVCNPSKKGREKVS
ncbi:hypothetical protein NHP21005_09470 [Helicobacter sp. NHP21005]|nr:hypothetical protein NHP21005_02770 [Helicobacter sp. NHP21005]BEG57259.1 hypothetical protein NHP21005_09470 [Helicobacter sp. NHP21005]